GTAAAGIGTPLDSASSAGMIYGSFAGRTQLPSARRYLARVQGVLDRIRARAFEAVVLTFAVASVVEAFAAQNVQHRILVALLALGWTLPFMLRARYPFWAPVVVCVFLSAFALTAPERSITSLTMPFVAALAAAVSLGLVADRRHSIAGWAAVVGT